MHLSGRDLACIRGGRHVFAKLSFELGTGEALLLTGPNGAGKSSLLRIVAGLLWPAAGNLQLAGADPDRLGDHIDRLYRAGWALTGSREAAEDLVQETYARVLARPRFLRHDEI